MPNWPTVTSWPSGDPTNGFTANSVLSATKRFWHDASDATATPNGSSVTDKFLNGYDVTQATGAKQPTVVTDAFGGRRSLKFVAASAQELVFTHASKINDFAGGTDVAYEWWAVFQLDSVAITQIVLAVDSSSSATTYSMNLAVGTAWTYQRRDGVGAATSRAQTGATAAITTPYILRARYTGTNAAWTINGIALTTAGSSDVGAMALDRLIYGAYGNGAGAHNSFAQMHLAESAGFTGTLSAADAAAYTTTLKNKWGITF